MAGSIRVAGHTIAEHDLVNDKVDVKNATLDSTVTFPAIGQLAFWYGNASASSSITFTLDGVSSYTVIFNGRHNSTPFFSKKLNFYY